MTDMIERVARALCTEDGTDPDGLDSQGQVWWTCYQDDARAAITSMREPIDRMVLAVASDKSGGVDLYRADDPSYNVREIWSDMIDAALNTQPDGTS